MNENIDLFKSIKIGNVNIKNIFFRAATYEGLADDEGHMTDELFKLYEDLADGGVGAIITSYASILEDEKATNNMLGIYDDSFIDEYKKLTYAVHSRDVKIYLQIAYGGSMTTRKPISEVIYEPSSVRNERTGIMPFACDKKAIEHIQEGFIDAALRAKKSGFDGVEIHAAHGYFLSHFLSPKYNIREDEYGGSIENRTRMICEIIEKTKLAVERVSEEINFNVNEKNIEREIDKSDFAIIVKQNSEDFYEEGLSAEDSLLASELFVKAGADAIEVSGGDSSSKYVAENNLGCSRGKLVRRKKNESYFKNHAIELSKRVDVPVILTGGNRHLDILENISLKSKVKFFGLSRPLVCEPNLIDKWKNGECKSAKCVSCNGCFNRNGKYCVLHD